MKIGIVPSIKSFYGDENNYILDKNWFSFLNKIFQNYDLEIINENSKNFNHDLVILCGGNDSLKFSKKEVDILRNKLDDYVIRNCIKKKIKLIGVCWGAIKINEYFNGVTKKIPNHVQKFHEINGFIKIKNKRVKKKVVVNSYHNFHPKKLGKNLIECMKCKKDNSTEMFFHNQKKIFGIMWHPERNKRISNFDKIIFKNL
jgi:N5-(cytidine 5'-diphosphoramidyl)-L-glutamine hydrolase